MDNPPTLDMRKAVLVALSLAWMPVLLVMILAMGGE